MLDVTVLCVCTSSLTCYHLLVFDFTNVLNLFCSALHMAAANGHLDIVDYLIRNGAVRKLFYLNFFFLSIVPVLA